VFNQSLSTKNNQLQNITYQKPVVEDLFLQPLAFSFVAFYWCVLIYFLFLLNNFQNIF